VCACAIRDDVTTSTLQPVKEETGTWNSWS
jgi:hypothetical protein